MNKLHFFLKNLLFSPVYQQGDILITYASQTGTAKDLALRSAELLNIDEQTISCLPLSQVSVEELDNYSQIIIFVSTCGEGDIPDNGISFYDKLIKREGALSTPVTLFSLGDRHYDKYCEAGKLFYQQFARLGAITEEQFIMVDGAPEQIWQSWLMTLTGNEQPLSSPNLTNQLQMTLKARQMLHSTKCHPDRGAYRLNLLSDQSTTFKAGDLIGITPPNETRERLYSISAALNDGVELCIGKVVYQEEGESKVGRCSDYLINQLIVGGSIHVTHRSQGSLVLPKQQQPLLMVATGTGIAPMICLLRERHSLTQNWLIFGNQHSEQDFYYRDDLRDLQEQEILTHLDLAFSRQQQDKIYVQDILKQQQEKVLNWLVNQNALLYICGQTHLKQSISDIIIDGLSDRFHDPILAKEFYQNLIDKEQIVFELY
ncbi:flavodoxin domain-containing protein [Vibrio sp. SS-MA-C1-2]|uniref:flavodoxin domain-containing protein n=1 Tax=Vibrio sp. SS-MA-C1-2 TaxID=2908646 RepID=UPI001F2BFBA5|nr:flavodoxin domain-containing protein [Vibrio sp. SS-MA-C1-2]UJF17275.1 flavodoxin domain-containing protein [Vibrio sp. SS-MA-C1-2]